MDYKKWHRERYKEFKSIFEELLTMDNLHNHSLPPDRGYTHELNLTPEQTEGIIKIANIGAAAVLLENYKLALNHLDCLLDDSDFVSESSRARIQDWVNDRKAEL